MSSRVYRVIIISVYTFLCLSAIGITGCGYIGRYIARSLADTTIEQEVRVPVGSIGDFGNCLIEPGGGCPRTALVPSFDPISTRMPEAIEETLRGATGSSGDAVRALGFGRSGRQDLANIARSTLESETHQQFINAYNQMMQRSITRSAEKPLPDPIRIDLTWSKLDAYFEAINDATQSGAWDVLEQQIQTAMEINRSLANDVKVVAYARLIKYIKEYMKAYFRNGKFIKATIDLSQLKENIKKKLKDRFGIIDDSTLDAMAGKLLQEFLSGGSGGGYEFVFGRIGTTAFVTRAGAEYQFPVIEAKIDPSAERPFTVTKIEPIIIGNDLLRVLLEASFDTWHQLPCVSNATARTLGQPVNDPEKATSLGSEHLSAEDFESVESWANRTESGSSTLVGRLVRGGGWLSLNNEALAQLLETMVGVFVRKSTEKAAWCAYSCRKTIPHSANKSARILSGTLDVKLVVRVQGKPPIFERNPWR